MADSVSARVDCGRWERRSHSRGKGELVAPSQRVDFFDAAGIRARNRCGSFHSPGVSDGFPPQGLSRLGYPMSWSLTGPLGGVASARRGALPRDFSGRLLAKRPDTTARREIEASTGGLRRVDTERSVGR